MSTKDPIRRCARFGAITVLAAAGTVALAGPAHAGNVAAGRNLEMAPGIDFALFETPDLASGTMVRLDVFRGATLVATKTAPVTDAGNVEVNHVGPGADDRGDCWDGDGTPDLRGGDELRATVVGAVPDDVDVMFARAIRFTEAPDGQLTGTAFGDDAGDLLAPLEVGPDDVFAAKRVNPPAPRQGADITDITNGNWSVHLPGEGGEVGVDFSTSHAGEGSQTTTAFPGPDDATGPCGDVRQSALTSNSHPEINIANVGTPMVVGGPEDGLGQATGVTFNGVLYAVTHGDTGWSATIPAADLATPLPEGTHTLLATFGDGTSDSRTVVKDVTAPTLTSSLAPGTYTGDQTTSLTSDTDGIRYTLDGSTPTATFGTPHAGGSLITLPQGGVRVLNARVADAVGNVTTLGPLSYDVRAPAATNSTGGTQNAGTTQAPGGTAGTGAGTTPPAGLVGTTGGTSILGLARLRPGIVRVASRARLRTVRRFGLGLKVDLPAGATLMQVRIARRIAGRDRHVQTVKFSVLGGETVATRLASSKLRTKFRPGTYVLRVTTGRSATTLGDAVTARVRIVR